MKILLSLLVVFSFSAVAEIFDMHVSERISICNENQCADAVRSPVPVTVQLDENGYGEYRLVRRVFEGWRIDRLVAVSKSSNSCFVIIQVDWTFGGDVESENIGISCDQFRKVKFDQIQSRRVINGTEYIFDVGIHSDYSRR